MCAIFMMFHLEKYRIPKIIMQVNFFMIGLTKEQEFFSIIFSNYILKFSYISSKLLLYFLPLHTVGRLPALLR